MVMRAQICLRDLPRESWTMRLNPAHDVSDRVDICLDGTFCGTYQGPMADRDYGARRNGVPFINAQPRFGGTFGVLPAGIAAFKSQEFGRMKPKTRPLSPSLTDFAMCWAPSTPGAFSGTDGSNPVPSTGESLRTRFGDCRSRGHLRRWGQR